MPPTESPKRVDPRFVYCIMMKGGVWTIESYPPRPASVVNRDRTGQSVSGIESPITRIPGYWADRHPVAVSIMLVVTLAALVAALAGVGR